MELVRGGAGDVHRLAGDLGVSVSTIRRDLAALAGRGQVMRTYGGAVHSDAVVEKSWHDKELAYRAEKAAIARRAAELVQPGDTVLLDAGTTAGRLAHYLKDRDDVTVVTNGLSALFVLADSTADVIVLGGGARDPYTSETRGTPWQSSSTTSS
ncbi:MAG: DeoR family transcriptional regulator [Actinophytocola sp.]|nr:DeoR family transcriptional regulator [Actinophytocola sp.]